MLQDARISGETEETALYPKRPLTCHNQKMESTKHPKLKCKKEKIQAQEPILFRDL